MPFKEDLKRPDLKGTYRCWICRKTFCHSSSLSRHRLVHKNAKGHSCSLCGTEIKENLRAHMSKMHKLSHVFTCPCCGSTFRDRKKLHTHTEAMKAAGRNGHMRKWASVYAGSPIAFCTTDDDDAAEEDDASSRTSSPQSEELNTYNLNEARGTQPMDIPTPTAPKVEVTDDTRPAVSAFSFLTARFGTSEPSSTSEQKRSTASKRVCALCKRVCKDVGSRQWHVFQHHVKADTGLQMFQCDACPIGSCQRSSIQRHVTSAKHTLPSTETMVGEDGEPVVREVYKKATFTDNRRIIRDVYCKTWMRCFPLFTIPLDVFNDEQEALAEEVDETPNVQHPPVSTKENRRRRSLARLDRRSPSVLQEECALGENAPNLPVVDVKPEYGWTDGSTVPCAQINDAAAALGEATQKAQPVQTAVSQPTVNCNECQVTSGRLSCAETRIELLESKLSRQDVRLRMLESEKKSLNEHCDRLEGTILGCQEKALGYLQQGDLNDVAATRAFLEEIVKSCNYSVLSTGASLRR